MLDMNSEELRKIILEVTSAASSTDQAVSRAASRVCSATEKVGDEFEFGVPTGGANLVHGGVHSRVESHQLRIAAMEGADEDRAPVGRIALTRNPTAVFESVNLFGIN